MLQIQCSCIISTSFDPPTERPVLWIQIEVPFKAPSPSSRKSICAELTIHSKNFYSFCTSFLLRFNGYTRLIRNKTIWAWLKHTRCPRDPCFTMKKGYITTIQKKKNFWARSLKGNFKRLTLMIAWKTDIQGCLLKLTVRNIVLTGGT